MFWTIVFIFTMLIGLLLFVLGFLINRWFFKPRNNPNKARIYVDGIDRPFEGTFDHSSKKGQVYKFQAFNKQKFVVVPKNYPYDYHYYKRTIYLDSLFNLFAYNKRTNIVMEITSEHMSILEELWQSKIGYQAVSKIKSLNQPKVSGKAIFIMIIAIVIAIGIGWYLRSPVTTLQNIPNTTQPETIQPQPQQNTPYIQQGE